MKKMFLNLKEYCSKKRMITILSCFIFILLVLTLNITYSTLKTTNNSNAANIVVNNMEYSMTINGASGTIIQATNNSVTKSNIGLYSLNSKSSKYELIYHVCSDSTCNEYIETPNNISIEYSSRTTDNISGEIGSSGNKNIRLIVTNESSTTYYIKMDINAGYIYNSLALENMITDKYNEEDVVIASYIDGELSTTFPTTSSYDTTVTCTSSGSTSNASGTSSWNGTKWVLNVTGIDTGETACNVYFVYHNFSPVIVNNTGVSMDDYVVNAVTITSSNLLTTDSDNLASELIYTVTEQPIIGSLSLTTFTQADINAGNLVYTETTGEGICNYDVHFHFSITDGINILTNQTFSINITSSAPISTGCGVEN